MTYEQLSKDPNSLANLDQDLPNYAQHNIRLFSLPQARCSCNLCCLFVLGEGKSVGGCLSCMLIVRKVAQHSTRLFRLPKARCSCMSEYDVDMSCMSSAVCHLLQDNAIVANVTCAACSPVGI